MARDTIAISRREFLAVFARTGLGASAASLGGILRPREGPAQSVTHGIREIQLEARELSWELAPGKVIKAMAYNGRVPGPEIRVKEGERVRVHLRNGLAEPTTIHWHGVDVPNAMDGVPGVTQKPVPPGETFVYEFDARPAGTRWYHTHYGGAPDAPSRPVVQGGGRQRGAVRPGDRQGQRRCRAAHGLGRARIHGPQPRGLVLSLPQADEGGMITLARIG